MSVRYPFHLAFPVDDLQAARTFYSGVLGCEEGRSAETWVDFNFHGHQIVAHLVPGKQDKHSQLNEVDRHHIPVPHFGVIMEWPDWERMADRLRRAGMDFIVEPYVRFAGQVGEQATMFLLDPAGNALEFKAFRHPEQIFAV